MDKKDLTLNKLQWLICDKTKPNKTKATNQTQESVHLCTRYFLIQIILKQIYLTFIWSRVDSAIIAMKIYSTLTRSPDVKPHNHMPFTVILKIHLLAFFIFIYLFIHLVIYFDGFEVLFLCLE